MAGRPLLIAAIVPYSAIIIYKHSPQLNLQCTVNTSLSLSLLFHRCEGSYRYTFPSTSSHRYQGFDSKEGIEDRGDKVQVEHKGSAQKDGKNLISGTFRQ